MSEREETPGEEAATPADPISDAGLDALRNRLGELQNQVDLLGSQGIWSEPAPPPPEPPDAPYGQPPPAEPYGPAPAAADPFGPPPAADPFGPPPGADPYGQPPATGPYGQPPAGDPYGPPPAADPYGQPPAADPYGPPPQPPDPSAFDPVPGGPPAPGAAPAWRQPEPEAAPPPIATNGHSDDHAEVSARSTSVALVDAGPFDDLIQLRHFEDDLASLTAVRDVRVRRFGHGRASIEVGMSGPYTLSRELYRLGREMSVTEGVAGDLVIDLAPGPEPQLAEGEEPPPEGAAEPIAEEREEEA